jgi:hypothetical protein
VKNLLALFFCGLCINPELHAERSSVGPTRIAGETFENGDFTGPTTLTDVKADSLSVTGPLAFHNLEVKNHTEITGPTSRSEKGTFNSLEITGPFRATDVTCNTLEARGPIGVTKLTVKQDATITGPLDARESHFQNITIQAQDIMLRDTIVEGDILVQHVKNKKQILRLKGRTIVKGNVTFESGFGKIELSSGSEIQGTTKNATVVNR